MKPIIIIGVVVLLIILIWIYMKYNTTVPSDVYFVTDPSSFTGKPVYIRNKATGKYLSSYGDSPQASTLVAMLPVKRDTWILTPTTASANSYSIQAGSDTKLYGFGSNVTKLLYYCSQCPSLSYIIEPVDSTGASFRFKYTNSPGYYGITVNAPDTNGNTLPAYKDYDPKDLSQIWELVK